ncbi:MAG: dipeptide ABC transporter permease DppC, partial [Gemmobacter sp.]
MNAVVDTAATDEPRRRVWWRSLLADRAAAVALAVLAVFVLGAILAPWIAPHDPYAGTRNVMLPPAWAERGRAEFLLGTDGQG